MKRYGLFKNIAMVLLRCFVLTGCTNTIMHRPDVISYGEYTGGERRKEILNVNLFSGQTLKELSAQGVYVQTYDYVDSDSLVDIEFIKDEKILRFTVNTHTWHRKSAEWFYIITWGGVSVYDGHIAVTYDGNIYVISLSDFKVEKILNVVGLPSNAVISNSLKTDYGWLVLFSTKDRQGFAPLNEKGVYIGKTIPLPDSYVSSYNGTEAFSVSQTNLSFAQDNDDIIIYSGLGFKYSHFGRSYVLNTKTGWFAKMNYYNFAEYQNYSQHDRYTDYYIFDFETVQCEEHNPHIMAVVAVDEVTEKLISYYTFDDDIIPAGFFEDGYERTYFSGYGKNEKRVETANPDMFHSMIFDFDKKTVESISAPIVTERIIDHYGDEDKWYANYDDYPYVLISRNTRYFDTDYTEYVLRFNQGEIKEKLLYTDYSQANHIRDVYFDENGNPVIYADYDLLIYDKDMYNTAPIYRVSDYISYGKDNTESGAIRTIAGYCNYKDSMVVAYYDMPLSNDIYLNVSQDDWQLKPVYKIAVIDSKGVIKEYDTDVHVLKFGENICGVEIMVDNIYTVRIKSNFNHANKKTYFEGTLNLKTGKYSPVIKFALQ